MIRQAAIFSLLAIVAGQAGGESAPPLFFGQPEVVKLDWNTRCPRCADFNGDGLADIALLNIDRARVEFLLQRKGGARPGQPERSSNPDRWNPVLELSRFDRQPLVVGSGMHALIVGDWNGDRRPDIACTTEDERLVLRTQGKTFGDWSQKLEFPLDSVSEEANTLVSADLNGDQRDDIAVLTESRLMIYLQSSGGGWQDVKTHALAEAGCSGLAAADLNGDGRLDVLCASSDGDAALVRLQGADGSFAEEWRLEIPKSRCWPVPVKIAGQTALAWLQNNTGMVELASLVKAESPANSELAASIRYAMPPAESKTGSAAFGDLTADGVADIVLADAKNARLWLFTGRKDGSFSEGREQPSLSGIEGMAVADVDADGKPELVLLSPAEKAIAIARWQSSRIAYPEIVHQSADPLYALAVGSLGSDGVAVHACTDAKSKASLLTLKWSGQEKKFTASAQELPKPPSKITAIRIVDGDQDGKGDLAVFSNVAAMQLLLSRPDPKAPFLKAEGIPDSLASKLPPSALTSADLDGDGKAELIAAREQVARAFRAGADGKVRIVEQINAPSSSSQLAAAIVTREGGKNTVLLIDTSGKKLHEMAAGADGVFRLAHSHALASAAFEECRALTGEGSLRVLLLGKASFDLMPLHGAAMQWKSLAAFDSELRDMAPREILAASFSSAASDDIVLLDSTKTRTLEFFRREAAGTGDWRSSLYFRVFEADPHYRGKSGFENEPHDFAAADLNGDSQLDLCLLAHDRLLIYLRQTK